MLIAISLFYSWYVLPHPSGAGSKLYPHGSIMEIFPCPDLFPFCTTSQLYKHTFLSGQTTSEFTGLSGFKTTLPKRPRSGRRRTFEPILLWTQCIVKLHLGFPLQTDRPVCQLFFCFLLGCRRFASPNTDLTSTSKYSRARVQLA